MKGFITIATGDEKYFKLAVNLLNSYKYASKNPLPFAILTDRENEYTKLFDDVVILENSTRSYLDKITLLKYTPYDETIFIDADCLAYGDLNKYFDKFSPGDEVSGFGKVLPLDSQDGWFKAENAGKYKDQLHFVTSFHGGIIYVRKNNTENEVCHKVYDLCMDILKDYSDYDFFYFKKPADEPVYGLALAVANCKPTKVSANHFCFFPETKNFKSNIIKGKLSYDFLGEEIRGDGMLCHFGNYNTVKQPYLAEVEKLNAVLEGRKFDAWKIHTIWSIKNMVGETEATIKKMLGIKRK